MIGSLASLAWNMSLRGVIKFIAGKKTTSPLTTEEFDSAERYWISLSQYDHFYRELSQLEADGVVIATSSLLDLHPLLDAKRIIRVGGRQHNSKMAFSRIHPIILHKKHPVTRLIVCTEHLRLLHAGPTLMMASLHQRYHIIDGRQLIRQVTHECVLCRWDSAKPKPQLLDQLPLERITPGPLFEEVGMDYAGPM